MVMSIREQESMIIKYMLLNVQTSEIIEILNLREEINQVTILVLSVVKVKVKLIKE